MNAMVYIRGHKSDLGAWADHVDASRSHNNVLPFFTRSENHFFGISWQFWTNYGNRYFKRNSFESLWCLINYHSQWLEVKRCDYIFKST